MRILSVSNFFDTHGGGLERVAGNLCREFANAGHEAVWAACDDDGLPDSAAEILPLRCANPLEHATGLPMPIPGPGSIRRLWDGVRSSHIVLVHDALYASSILAMGMAKLAGKPTVLIQHIGSIRFANRLLAGVMRLANRAITLPMMRAADRLIFISATVRKEFAEADQSIPSILLFNGIDSGIFNRQSVDDRETIRSRWGLPSASPLLVFVGRFVEKKGLDIVREIARQRPDLHIALIGKGPLDPSSWMLKNVQDIGQLDQPSLASLYRASDLLILPSVGEGFPLVVQEAMACGLPVVTGSVTVCADPGASMFLTGVPIELSDPRGSAKRCCEAIDSVLSNPPNVDAMADYATSSYNWQKMAEKVIEGLPAVIGDEAARADPG